VVVGAEVDARVGREELELRDSLAMSWSISASVASFTSVIIM